MKTYVLYHAQCPDGFGAAYAAWKVLGEQAQYLPVSHHYPPPAMEAKSRVFIVDFCYSRKETIALAEAMEEVIILDHHQSAEADIQSLDLSQYSNLKIEFNMQKSGAVLSWEYFHPDQELPLFLAYIQDKDLWRFDLKDSREFSAALRGYDMDFQLWDSFQVEDLIKEGAVLLRYQQQLVNKACRNVRWVKIKEHKIPAVNSNTLQSEIGNTLCKQFSKAPFAVVYFDTSDKRYYSLRSIGDFDVAEVAGHFGGGGHKNAAGFAEPLLNYSERAMKG